MALSRNQTPAEGLVAVLDEWIRYSVHTALPGIIETYNASTRRAQVLLAIEALMEDGKCHARAPLLDVPVLFPSGSGGTILIELRKGDNVWVMFAERGIQDWKKTLKLAQPSPRHVFSPSDAVALAGFGPASSVTPASNSGISIQSNNADLSITVDGNSITLDVPDDATIKFGSSSAFRRLVTEEIIDLFNNHTHNVSGGRTGRPTSGITKSSPNITSKVFAE